MCTGGGRPGSCGRFLPCSHIKTAVPPSPKQSCCSPKQNFEQLMSHSCSAFLKVLAISPEYYQNLLIHTEFLMLKINFPCYIETLSYLLCGFPAREWLFVCVDAHQLSVQEAEGTAWLEQSSACSFYRAGHSWGGFLSPLIYLRLFKSEVFAPLHKKYHFAVRETFM